MNKRQSTVELKPRHMALCMSCADGVRQTYGERQVDYERTRSGICGLCGHERIVHSVDLYPQIRRTYRQQTGGGERHRAGR